MARCVSDAAKYWKKIVNDITYQWLHEQIRFYRDEIKDSDVLECGSLDVNGSIRNDVEEYKPASYLGIDLFEGPSVDTVMDVTNLEFDDESFDIVITTEMLEHVEDWTRSMEEMKRVLKIGGMFIITTRIPGFPRHGYPYDFWRFDEQVMRDSLYDFDIQNLTLDFIELGIFVTAIKRDKQINYKYPKAHSIEDFQGIYSITEEGESEPNSLVYWGTTPKEKRKLFRRNK